MSKIKNSPDFMGVIELLAKHRLETPEIMEAPAVLASENRKLRELTKSLGHLAETVEVRESKRNRNSFGELRFALLEISAASVAWLEALEVEERQRQEEAFRKGEAS